MLGLLGCVPETIDPEIAETRFAELRSSQRLALPAGPALPFDLARDIVFDLDRILPGHSNAMTFAAFDGDGRPIKEDTFYRFVVREGDEVETQGRAAELPYPYRNAVELLSLCQPRTRPRCGRVTTPSRASTVSPA